MTRTKQHTPGAKAQPGEAITYLGQPGTVKSLNIYGDYFDNKITYNISYQNKSNPISPTTGADHVHESNIEKA